MKYEHKSVLVQEVLTYLAPQKNGLYVDVTFGGGGHTQAILAAEPSCSVIGFDWDQDALEKNSQRIHEAYPGRFTGIWGNFAQLELLLKKHKVRAVNGILADFGTSQYQIHQKAGFSFAVDTFLDMRMSPGHQKITAADILNTASEQELAHIFFTYGEERYARQVAQMICAERLQRRITTTFELAELIKKVVPTLVRGIHPATRIFQALRIVVNKELDNIHAFLRQATRVLLPQGRLVCISFHSLEDRLVKQFFYDHRDAYTVLTPRVITASPEELAHNLSARSAKLRAAQKK